MLQIILGINQQHRAWGHVRIAGNRLAQGIVATIGFAIAGVPAALLLGVATALLSLIPIGPPLIWGGAAAWLFYQGTVGWGIFMLLWGFFLDQQRGQCGETHADQPRQQLAVYPGFVRC